MKKYIKLLSCVLAVIMALMLTGMLASASPIDNINVAETENGTVSVVEVNGKAEITLTPDAGYLAVSATLGNKRLTQSDEPNVYVCSIPEKATTLKVSFRRTNLTLSEDQLAMNAGESVTVTAKLSYIDGNLETRLPVKKNDILFASSDESVVSVDENGKLTAHKMGYARITASAVAGNEVEDFFYVIVDGDKSPVIGTIQLNAFFSASDFLTHLNVDELSPGHCFLVFTNTSGHDITINTSNLFHCEVPTEEFYNAVNSYNGEAIDPITYFGATDGELYDSENDVARASHAAKYTTRYERGELTEYTIKNNDIATFGNTGDGELSEVLAGDFSEILTRLGKKYDYDNLKNMLKNGEIDVELFFVKVIRLVTELTHDLSTDYNPFNGKLEGGECLNHELYAQAYYRDYRDATACKTEITQVQLEAMVDYIQYDNYFTILERNCTYVATNAWNLVHAATEKYQFETSSLMAPLFVKNDIRAKALVLAKDKNIEFYDGIGVIKPMKTVCANGTHELTLTDAKITKAGKLTCGDCGYSEASSTLTEMTLKIGRIYNEKVLGMWKSSNRKVAIVSAFGTIIPISKGETTITCRKGGVTYSCTVTVK